MKEIVDNIEIEYEEEAKAFIKELIEYLLLKRNSIYTFFNFIPSDKIKIKIISSQTKLREIYNDNVSDQEMPDWVVGFSTLDKTVYLLSFNEYSNTPHKYETFEGYKKTLIHEFVHAVHDLFCGGRFTGLRPIWEGVAIFLSEQYEEEGKLTVSKEDLINQNCHFKEFNYFFNALIDTYNHETILDILANKIDGYQVLNEIYDKTNSLK